MPSYSVGSVYFARKGASAPLLPVCVRACLLACFAMLLPLVCLLNTSRRYSFRLHTCASAACCQRSKTFHRLVQLRCHEAIRKT
jgi:hypothetical protein